MAVYYNDADPAACAWLRGLIAAGFLPAGEVDARSILEVEPADLRGFAQCHFFAGIGGWPHALRLAGVAEDRPVWTAWRGTGRRRWRTTAASRVRAIAGQRT